MLPTRFLINFVIVSSVTHSASSNSDCVVNELPRENVALLEKMVLDVVRSPHPHPPPSLDSITTSLQDLASQVSELGGEINETLRTFLLSSRNSSVNIVSDATSSHSARIVRNLRNVTAQTQNILDIIIEKEVNNINDMKQSLRKKRDNNVKLMGILEVLRNFTQASNEQIETQRNGMLNKLILESAAKSVKLSEAIQDLADKNGGQGNSTHLQQAGYLKNSLQVLNEEIRNLTAENIRLKASLETETFRPVDCHDVYMAGYRTSGVYTIFPAGLGMSSGQAAEDGRVQVWCFLGSEQNLEGAESLQGGWTVILKRDKGSFPAENLESDKRTKDVRFAKNFPPYQTTGQNRHVLSLRSRNDSWKINSSYERESGNVNNGTDVKGDYDTKVKNEDNSTTNKFYSYSGIANNNASKDNNPDQLENNCNNTKESSGDAACETHGRTNFTRSWEDYVTGFGSPHHEYFIGLGALYAMTSLERYSLTLLVAWEGKKPEISWAHWGTMQIKGPNDKYRLKVRKYSPVSSLPDVLAAHHRQQFSTYDNDHDSSEKNCAKMYGGGWWFGSCYDIHPTGGWHESAESFRGVMVGRWRPITEIDSWKRRKRRISPVNYLILMVKPEICDGS
ncbi:uncharacterized protein LOC108679390 [Hyalella azteca]|uniref:Uncharacterized protein LOC108679390 n=1 Tax=Hyalella azteca TaxID=294128 RepID=A0A8B7PCU5_HYAAZ|nr:uncharacterized protein LOC108679390 [Hyalella azteca]